MNETKAASLWPSRLWIAAFTAITLVFGLVATFSPDAQSLGANWLGQAGNVQILGISALFLFVMLFFATFWGYSDPYIPPPLPKHERLKVVEHGSGLNPEKILEKELEYASGTADQAMEHRQTTFNFYLLVVGGLGTIIGTLVISKPGLAVASVPLLWLMAVVGGLFFYQIIALRRAWARSVMAMNYIKEFYIANNSVFTSSGLASAFLWNPLTIPSANRRGSVFYFTAMLIALINSAAFFVGIYLLGYNVLAKPINPPTIVVAGGLSAIFFMAHLWTFDMMLIPRPEKPYIHQPNPYTTLPAPTVDSPDDLAVGQFPALRRTAYTSGPVSGSRVIGTRRIYDGRVVHLRIDEIRLPDGSTTIREVVEHIQAAVVIPYFPETDEVLFVEQYRDPIAQILLELPAGLVEPGETPDQTARRELREETGYEAHDIIPLFAFFTSPGFTDEKLHLFLAPAPTRIGGIADPNEIDRLHRILLRETLALIVRGVITDSKTIIGLQALALNPPERA